MLIEKKITLANKISQPRDAFWGITGYIHLRAGFSNSPDILASEHSPMKRLCPNTLVIRNTLGIPLKNGLEIMVFLDQPSNLHWKPTQFMLE